MGRGKREREKKIKEKGVPQVAGVPNGTLDMQILCIVCLDSIDTTCQRKKKFIFTSLHIAPHFSKAINQSFSL